MRTSKTRVANNFEAPEFSILTQPVVTPKRGRGGATMNNRAVKGMGMGTYNKAALKGMGTYNKAALRGMGTYNKAALRGMGGKNSLLYNNRGTIGMGKSGTISIPIRLYKNLGKKYGSRSIWDSMNRLGTVGGFSLSKAKDFFGRLISKLLPKAAEKGISFGLDSITNALDNNWGTDEERTEKATTFLKDLLKDTKDVLLDEVKDYKQQQQQQHQPETPTKKRKPASTPTPMDIDDDEHAPPTPPRPSKQTSTQMEDEDVSVRFGNKHHNIFGSGKKLTFKELKHLMQ